jgi:hypothetical protein
MGKRKLTDKQAAALAEGRAIRSANLDARRRDASNGGAADPSGSGSTGRKERSLDYGAGGAGGAPTRRRPVRSPRPPSIAGTPAHSGGGGDDARSGATPDPSVRPRSGFLAGLKAAILD